MWLRSFAPSQDWRTPKFSIHGRPLDPQTFGLHVAKIARATATRPA